MVKQIILVSEITILINLATIDTGHISPYPIVENVIIVYYNKTNHNKWDYCCKPL